MKLNSGVDMVKEINVSKVCPVCKTFSSSSNNTLNAHIDRCLSGESSMKLPESPKIKKEHRIKPRNTRLMLDIYKTAPRCTIEELDRRNGTNWATNSSFPDQELEFQSEELKDKPSKIVEHEGNVYIDTNGTKVRILSTLNFSKLDDNEAGKLQKRGKRIKFMSKKKKKKGDVQNSQQKMFKPGSSSKMLSKKFGEKIIDKHAVSGQEENIAVESCIKENGGETPMIAQVHNQMDDLAFTRPPWTCSKRTGLSKKRKFQDFLKQKSSMEEDMSKKLAFDPIVNDLEVKKKKLVISKLDGNFSSVGIEITSESAVIDQVPFQGSFTGLRNSMDDDFAKIVSQLDNKLDSRDGIDDDIDKQGSYFLEVDPILIPGPPGSFLPPSPGADDMVSGEEDELQGNSSLTTTSRVRSSDQDHHSYDMMNHDFISDSPISNVSSPSYARSPQHKKFVNTNLRSVDAISTEKSPTCCSRKEGAHLQESSEQVLQSNMRSNSLNFRPNLLSLTLPPPQTFKFPSESSVKLPVSPSTPVLRLMGKDLIVVNTDEEKFRPPLGSSPTGHQPFHNIHNENHNNSLLYGYPPQHDTMTQYYNYHPPKFSRSLSDLRPVHALDTMFPNARNDLMPPTKMETDVNMDNALSNATKEIIVIDDSPENNVDDHIFNTHMRRKQASSSYISMHESHSFTKTQSPLPCVSHMCSTSSAYYSRSFSLPTTRREDRV